MRPCLKTPFSILLHTRTSFASQILPSPVVSITYTLHTNTLVSFRFARVRCISAGNKHLCADSRAFDWNSHTFGMPSVHRVISVGHAMWIAKLVGLLLAAIALHQSEYFRHLLSFIHWSGSCVYHFWFLYLCTHTVHSSSVSNQFSHLVECKLSKNADQPSAAVKWRKNQRNLSILFGHRIVSFRHQTKSEREREFKINNSK